MPTLLFLAAISTLLATSCQVGKTTDNVTSTQTTPGPQPTGIPSHMEIPNLLWADGVEPASELENHPLVRAAREAYLALDVAWNTGDYSSDLLMRRIVPEFIAVTAVRYSQQGDNPHVRPYSDPWQPIEITSFDETGGRFTACFLGGVDGWWKDAESPGGAYDRSQATLREISMVMDDGELKLSRHNWPVPLNKECDGSVVPVGFFDPAPELPPTPVTKPVKPPLFADWENLE